MDENNQAQVPQQPIIIQQVVEKPKKPIYKRWWFWVLIVLAVIVIIPAATSGSDDPTEPVTDVDGQTIATTAAAASKDIMEGSGTLGKYDVEIVSAQVGKQYDNDVLIVSYKWTNNGTEAKSFTFAFEDKAYQNGIECTTTYMIVDQTMNPSADIKPGATFTVLEAYKLNDLTTPVEIEVGESISFNSKKVVKTFALD